MLRSYVTIAMRKLSRERLYVSINVFSLALGIAGFLILALYLRSELTYDRHHTNRDRIYRFNAVFADATGRVQRFGISPLGFGPMLVADYPQIGQQVRFRPAQLSSFKRGDAEGRWEDVYFADPTVFDIFTHKIVYGDTKTAFDNPHSIAVSESVARHYFGNENPIGQKLSAMHLSLTVTLVYADFPENTHLRYAALLPMSLMNVLDPSSSRSILNTLYGVGGFTYVMTAPGVTHAELDSLSKEFVANHMGEVLKSVKSTFEPLYLGLADLHFGEPLEGDRPVGNIFYVYGFAAVAAFILLIACINYMNLATARAAKRAKEIGMRKVLGATRGQLIQQFLGESFALTFIAAGAGLLLIVAALTLTPLGSLMGKEQLLVALIDPKVVLSLAVLVISVSLVAGLYPAFYLSSISPHAALVQVRSSWRTGVSMRACLVFLQLVVSIGVIASTLLMTDQIRYVRSKPLGFEKENRLLLTLRGYDVVRHIGTIGKELRMLPNVIDMTAIQHVPGAGNWHSSLQTETNEGTFEPLLTDTLPVGRNFVAAMGLQLVAGRGFSEEIATDTDEARIVNESFVKRMRWEQPLGKRFQMDRGRIARVVGVVKDFHYATLHNAIGPLMMHPLREDYSNTSEPQKPLLTMSIVVALSGEQIGQTMQRVREVITRFDSDFDFEPVFLEDKLDELYQSETRLMELTGVFSGVCILIAMLGLFGLTAFATEQRTKEIGIRMVLGASDFQIATLVSRHLPALLIVAAVPASILSYYAIDRWLERFAYHTDPRATTFIVSVLSVAVVALATVLLQSLRTTRSNPIKALRHE